MNRIKSMTKEVPMVQKADSILSKGAQLDNLRQAVASVQEILDIIMKSDTFSN